jgi:hypothetical protein
MKQPVDHILRPLLPWRSAAAITECGLDASKVNALTRDAYLMRHKELGMQRCALLTCMTCSQTAHNYKTWAEDPRNALAREIAWETAWHREDRGNLLLDELRAIAELIETHRDEFDDIVRANAGRRDWLKQKAEHAKRQSKDG